MRNLKLVKIFAFHFFAFAAITQLKFSASAMDSVAAPADAPKELYMVDCVLTNPCPEMPSAKDFQKKIEKVILAQLNEFPIGDLRIKQRSFQMNCEKLDIFQRYDCSISFRLTDNSPMFLSNVPGGPFRRAELPATFHLSYYKAIDRQGNFTGVGEYRVGRFQPGIYNANTLLSVSGLSLKNPPVFPKEAIRQKSHQ